MPGVADTIRDGAAHPDMPSPVGSTLTEMLTDPSTGLVLDSWYDADGQPEGSATTFVGP